MINPEMLVLARQARGLTQKELALSIGITQGSLSKFEDGIKAPSEETFNKIITQLKFPKEFYVQNIELRGLPVSINSGNFRKKQNVIQLAMNKTIALYNIYALNLLSVKDIIFKKSNNLPNIYYKNNVEKAAQEVRKLFNLGSGAVTNLVKTLEDNGIRIILCNLGTNNIDAFSCKIDNNPVIFLRANIGGDRQKFTLAHELAHLVMHYQDDNYSEKMEDEANDFASEFLMPAEKISDDLQFLNIKKLLVLKQKWKVSMQALIYRAKALKKISESNYRFLFLNLSKMGYRKAEPNMLSFEEPLSIIKELKEKMPNLNLEETFKLHNEDIKELYNF